jgi:hypothetical protein
MDSHAMPMIYESTTPGLFFTPTGGDPVDLMPLDVREITLRGECFGPIAMVVIAESYRDSGRPIVPFATPGTLSDGEADLPGRYDKVAEATWSGGAGQIRRELAIFARGEIDDGAIRRIVRDWHARCDRRAEQDRQADRLKRISDGLMDVIRFQSSQIIQAGERNRPSMPVETRGWLGQSTREKG